ncbi:MAG: PHP domain-containing protein [Clostridiales bacterium]|jgi:predicted metal-dependent phosphoesterase TrpH|nr:PHP domain-containing protein [Clostridiales bacterium]
MIDLHLHTEFSDGTDSCRELLDKLLAAGCGLFSVTDHDYTGGNFAMLEELRLSGALVKFITGIEVSAVFEGTELHLLGYGFDLNNPGIKALVEDGSRKRHQKLLAIFGHLENTHKIFLPEADKASLKKRAVVGKPNVAALLTKNGYPGTVGELIKRYMEDIDTVRFKTDARLVTEAVNSAGGLVSFAHPIEVMKEYGWDYKKINGFAKKLKDIGLSAIEVYHSSHGERDVRAYGAIAERLGLLVSGGSDYHGALKKARPGQLTAYGYSPKESELTVLKRLNV